MSFKLFCFHGYLTPEYSTFKIVVSLSEINTLLFTCTETEDVCFCNFIHDLKSVHARHGFFFGSPVVVWSLLVLSSVGLLTTGKGKPSIPVLLLVEDRDPAEAAMFKIARCVMYCQGCQISEINPAQSSPNIKTCLKICHSCTPKQIFYSRCCVLHPISTWK